MNPKHADKRGDIIFRRFPSMVKVERSSDTGVSGPYTIRKFINAILYSCLVMYGMFILERYFPQIFTLEKLLLTGQQVFVTSSVRVLRVEDPLSSPIISV